MQNDIQLENSAFFTFHFVLWLWIGWRPKINICDKISIKMSTHIKITAKFNFTPHRAGGGPIVHSIELDR